MTDKQQHAVWLDDLDRGTFPLNHFMYCYVHPENIRLLLVGVRLTAARSADGLVRFDCPMLELSWTGPCGAVDFRPDIARELYRGVGLKRDERMETYKLCPFPLAVRRVDFITNHTNDMKLDLDGAYWLPQVDTNWKRALRAA